MKLMQSFRRLSAPIAAALVFPMFLASCGHVAQGLGSIGGGGQVGELSFDAKEQQILGQARGIGALVGAGAGYAIGRNTGLGGLGGALLGGALGAVAGDGIGKNQANNARQARLDNDTLRGMIASARANNAKIAAYNRKVEARIAAISKANAAERAGLAKSERISVDRAIKAVDKQIETREATRAKLTGSDASQLAVEIRKAKSERAQLASNRSKLVRYESVASN